MAAHPTVEGPVIQAPGVDVAVAALHLGEQDVAPPFQTGGVSCLGFPLHVAEVRTLHQSVLLFLILCWLPAKMETNDGGVMLTPLILTLDAVHVLAPLKVLAGAMQMFCIGIL